MRQHRADGVEETLHVHVDHLLDNVGLELEERPVGPTLAFATAMSSRPKRSTVAAASASTWSGARTSHVRATAPFDAEIGAAPRRQAELHTLLVERPSRGRADSAARAGHNRHLAFELGHGQSQREPNGFMPGRPDDLTDRRTFDDRQFPRADQSDANEHLTGHPAGWSVIVQDPTELIRDAPEARRRSGAGAG